MARLRHGSGGRLVRHGRAQDELPQELAVLLDTGDLVMPYAALAVAGLRAAGEDVTDPAVLRRAVALGREQLKVDLGAVGDTV